MQMMMPCWTAKSFISCFLEEEETKKDCFRFHSQKLSAELQKQLDLPSKKARFLRQQKENKHTTTTVVSWDVCCCYMVTHPDVMSVPKRNWPCSFHDKWKSLFSKKSVPFSASKLRICPPARRHLTFCNFHWIMLRFGYMYLPNNNKHKKGQKNI